MPKTQIGVREQDLICKTRNGEYTTQSGIFYLKNWISAWRLSLISMYTTDKGGALHGLVPFMDIDKVVRTQGRAAKPQPEKFVRRVTERYLSTHHAYIIEARPNANGDRPSQFVESRNPANDISVFLTKMGQQVICPVCGLQGINETERPTGEEECPRCNQAKFKLKHDFDVLENTIRIQKLLQWKEKHGPKVEAKEPPPNPVQSGTPPQ